MSPSYWRRCGRGGPGGRERGARPPPSKFQVSPVVPASVDLTIGVLRGGKLEMITAVLPPGIVGIVDLTHLGPRTVPGKEQEKIPKWPWAPRCLPAALGWKACTAPPPSPPWKY